MLSFNTMEDTIKALDIRTERQWTQQSVLECCLVNRIPLVAVASVHSVVAVYAITDDKDAVGVREKFRMPAGHVPLARVFPWHIAYLLAWGAVTVFDVPDERSRMEGETKKFVEGVMVTPALLRFLPDTINAIVKACSDAERA